MTRRALLTALLCAAASLATPGLLLSAPASASASDDWRWPVDGELVTRYRNGDDPYAAGQHRGIDVAAPSGSEVSAATAGRVTFAGSVGSAGSTVSIRTADGRFDTSYLHLGSIDVDEGDVVSPGTKIGTVGASGSGSVDRPHLHFGVRDAGTDHAYRDPLQFLGEPPSSPLQPPPVVAPRQAAREGAPAPSASPVRAPAPAHGRAPGHARAPSGAPSLLPAPLPAPGHAFGRGPARAPGRAPEEAPRGETAPKHGPERSGESHGGHVPAQSPLPRPELGPDGPRPGTDQRLEAGRAPQPTRTPGGVGAPGGHGPDAGWIVACIGLVVAATALARRGQVSRMASRGRTAVGSLMRPLWRGG
jgi:hypothetical protein